jgi:hypothetical protein
MAKAIGNLPKGRAGDRCSAIDVVDQSCHVIQNEGEVRIELAFHGRCPSA